MPSISVATIDADASGTLILSNAAENAGLTLETIDINSESAIERINSSSSLIIRIGPKGYGLYQNMVPHLEGVAKKTVVRHLDAFNKATSMALLNTVGIEMPKSEVVNDMTQLLSWELPYVLKVSVGNAGNGVHLINTMSDIDLYFEPNRQMIVQEFIAESIGSDKRLFVVGSQVVASMYRKSANGDFRANVHQGGSMHAYTPTPAEVDIAVRASRAHGLDFSGVDIIDSKRGPLVLEVNPSPGFAIQAVSSVPIAETVLNYVVANN